jgi:hypothetical protein
MMKHLAILCILLLALAALVRAEEVHTRVKYVGAGQVYLDAGRLQGVQSGDTVIIRRHDAQLVTLLATFVADHSTSCNVPAKTPELRVDDEVVILITAAPTTAAKEDTTHPVSAIAATVSPGNVKVRRTNHVSGRIGVQYLMQSDHDPLHFNYQQPSLTVRLLVEDLWGSPYQLSVRMNGRRTIRQQELGPNTQSGWTGRVYEIALAYTDPNAAFSWAAGRVLPDHLRGILPFDGMQAAYRVSNQVAVGGVAGTLPNLTTTEPSGSETQFGAYAAYERDGGHSLSATVGLIGQYHRGIVSREFIYQQVSYIPQARFYMFESGEVNVNRAWKRGAGERAVDLANMLVSAGYNPVSSIMLGLSVDDRANYRTWETRTTPDSLFDDSRRQGTHLNMAWRAWRLLRLTAGGGLSWRDAAGHAARSANFGASLADLPMSGTTVSLAWMTFDNAYIRGSQPSAQVSQQLAARWLVSAQIGSNTYDYQTGGANVKNNWFKIQADVFFTRAIYAATYFEAYRGDSPDVNNFFVEWGIRL